nr:TetR/AcrR family transcriptional regulator C-terminal domain-containing protein [Marihabitans asiaticum]
MDLLERVGLPDLTMRALGAELGVQQSALYHHVASKQELLGLVADAILERAPRRPARADASWQTRVRRRCEDVRAAVLAYPDGADLVLSMWAFGLGGGAPEDELRALLLEAGLEEPAASTASRTLLHFVYGHAYAQQAHDHAARLGAVVDHSPDDFGAGLALVVAGIASR